MPDNRRIPQPHSQVPGKSKKPAAKGAGCFTAIIYFLFIIGASALLAGLGWLTADDVLALTKEDISAAIEVKSGDDVGAVAAKLKDAGIIRYPFLFKLYAGFSDAKEKIDPGSYEVSATMDYRALIYAMRATSNFRSVVTVTIPEGFTLEQTLQRLSDSGVNTYESLKDVCANYEFEYSFLTDVPLGDKRLEGFLFPDTYNFYVNESPVSTINKLLSNFNQKMTAELRTKVENSGYSMQQVLTIASLIEKEAANDEERANISSVIHNRLNSKSMKYLQVDASIQYFLPERKEKLTYDDLKIDNPYNTYLYEGLPPGPICNPGLKSIKAALDPNKTKYYFSGVNRAEVNGVEASLGLPLDEFLAVSIEGLQEVAPEIEL
jgi:UPF0755 protein